MRMKLTGGKTWPNGYHGGRLSILVGQVVDIPEHEAARLLRDYPLDFIAAGPRGEEDAATSWPVHLDRLRAPNAKVRVGVVLTTFNGLGMTARCVQTLAPVPGVDVQVYVVDNCSTDGTLAWLRRNGIDHEQPIGRCCVAKALNLGREWFQRAKPEVDHLFVLNNDVVLPDGYLASLVAHLEANPRCGWVTGYIRGLPEALVPTKPTSIGERMITGDCSAGLLRMSASKEVGPWDERFVPRYSEDEDLVTRLLLAGWDCIRLPIPFDGKTGGYVGANPGAESQKESYRRSVAIYIDKWGDAPPSGKDFMDIAADILGGLPCRGHIGGKVPEPVHRRGKRAAIVQNGHTGDIVLTFPVARELKELGYSVTWYAVPPYIAAVRCSPDVDEVVDSSKLELAKDGMPLWAQAAAPARRDAHRKGFDVIVDAQISPQKQDEFLRSPLAYMPFMYGSIGLPDLASHRPRLKPPPECVRAELDSIGARGGARVFLNLCTDSAAIRIDFRYWSEFVVALAAAGVETVYNEPHGHVWRGDATVQRLGKVRNLETLLYLARAFDMAISASSGPVWSFYAEDKPALVLLPREVMGPFEEESGVLRQYAMARQGWQREWECADVVVGKSGRAEKFTPRELADVVIARIRLGHDLRAFEIAAYCDILKGYGA